MAYGDLLYDGGCLTAAVDGKRSETEQPVYGKIDRCAQPLRIGAATDKKGNLVSFFSGKMATVTLTVPKVTPPDVTIPGEVQTDRVVRVLAPDVPEVLYLSVDEPCEMSVAAEFLEASEDAVIDMELWSEEGRGGGEELTKATLKKGRLVWRGRLEKGAYRLRLRADKRIVYRLKIKGAGDVWQTVFHTTDRGAGATAAYTAWLATKRPGKHKAEIFDCSEGARLLFLAEGGSVQARIQTGGVMGDSSARMGGRGIWKEHAFRAGPRPCGAWFFYPSKINASRDYAVRGDFTIHWRKPPESITKQFNDSPTMRAMEYTTRGGETAGANRAERYRETIEAGLSFMEALTEETDDGARILERWMTDRDGRARLLGQRRTDALRADLSAHLRNRGRGEVESLRAGDRKAGDPPAVAGERRSPLRSVALRHYRRGRESVVG